MDNFLWEEKWMLFASFYKPKNVKKIMDQDAGLPSMDGWNVKIFSDRDVGRVTEVVLWVVWCGLCMCSVPQLNSTRDQIHQHLYLVTFFLFFFGIRNQEKISELFNTWNVLTAQLALVCHYNNLGVVFKTEPLEAAWKFFRLTLSSENQCLNKYFLTKSNIICPSKINLIKYWILLIQGEILQ